MSIPRTRDFHHGLLERQRVSMGQVHIAGEKLSVDYCGGKPEVLNPTTGVSHPVEFLVV